MSDSIYRSPAGRAEVLRLYEGAVERLGVAVQQRSVPTSRGHSHVLVAGPEDAPPLVLFQGGNFLGPLTLAWFRPLMDEWRLYAPDTVGHPGRSAEMRLSPDDASYGEWAAEVLDGLGLERAPVIGLSYGAGIVLRLASIQPERIERAALLMPAGIVSPPVLPLLARIVPWMLLYRLAPWRAWLQRAARPMFTGAPEEAWLEALGAVFRHLVLERGMPRNATRRELGGLRAPVLVLAGAEDPFFPGRRVIERTREILPEVAAAELLEGCAHLPDAATVAKVNERIRRFLSG